MPDIFDNTGLFNNHKLLVYNSELSPFLTKRHVFSNISSLILKIIILTVKTKHDQKQLPQPKHFAVLR